MSVVQCVWCKRDLKPSSLPRHLKSGYCARRRETRDRADLREECAEIQRSDMQRHIASERNTALYEAHAYVCRLESMASEYKFVPATLQDDPATMREEMKHHKIEMKRCDYS
jgi:hypothetical protein